MIKVTPKRHKPTDEKVAFSPIILPTSPVAGSPHKNLTGPPRIIRDIIADLFNNIQKWNTLHVKGCALVKQIASIKIEEPNLYSPQLEENITELYEVTQSLGGNKDFFVVLINQAEAFLKLLEVNHSTNEVIFFSVPALHISQLVKNICEAYRKEFQVKQFVLQNIAHSKNKNEGMFLAAYWTHQLNINKCVSFDLECLLVETGHRTIK